MADDLLDRYRRRLPDLFAKALAQLEQRAREGDRALRERLDRMTAEPVASLLVLEGEGGGELSLLAGRHGFAVSPQPPGAVFGYALAIPVLAGRHGLAMFERGGIDVEEAARGLATLASATARELFMTVSFCFELELTEVPALGVLRARLSLGRAALLAKPEFKLTVGYDELLDAREEGIAPHQLFLAGKIMIDGDVAKAMMLGMTLAQLD